MWKPKADGTWLQPVQLILNAVDREAEHHRTVSTGSGLMLFTLRLPNSFWSAAALDFSSSRLCSSWRMWACSNFVWVYGKTQRHRQKKEREKERLKGEKKTNADQRGITQRSGNRWSEWSWRSLEVGFHQVSILQIPFCFIADYYKRHASPLTIQCLKISLTKYNKIWIGGFSDVKTLPLIFDSIWESMKCIFRCQLLTEKRKNLLETSREGKLTNALGCHVLDVLDLHQHVNMNDVLLVSSECLNNHSKNKRVSQQWSLITVTKKPNLQAEKQTQGQTKAKF